MILALSNTGQPERPTPPSMAKVCRYPPPHAGRPPAQVKPPGTAPPESPAPRDAGKPRAACYVYVRKTPSKHREGKADGGCWNQSRSARNVIVAALTDARKAGLRCE